MSAFQTKTLFRYAIGNIPPEAIRIVSSTLQDLLIHVIHILDLYALVRHLEVVHTLIDSCDSVGQTSVVRASEEAHEGAAPELLAVYLKESAGIMPTSIPRAG
jgi:hypothetical protein